ncbi:MAG: hypothetical protein AVDCRST_MAG64-381, partial [uncultured Phycisphaerae bacterium]
MTAPRRIAGFVRHGRLAPGLTTMVKTERAMTRFRCGHCATRLVVQNRHLDRLVACHACGRATHPVAQRLAGAQAGGAHPGGAPAPAAISARKP